MVIMFKQVPMILFESLPKMGIVQNEVDDFAQVSIKMKI